MSKQWKNRLRSIMEGSQVESGAESQEEKARRRIVSFIHGTVVPAFEELKEELEDLGREVVVSVEKFSHQASLTVYKGEDEEFYYAVRGRAYRRKPPAFPVVRDESDQPLDLWVETDLRSGAQTKARVEAFFKQDVIDDFLEQYRKWMDY
jgi:hypothetical protein